MHGPLCLYRYIYIHSFEQETEMYTPMPYLVHTPLSLPTVNALKTDWLEMFCSLAS